MLDPKRLKEIETRQKDAKNGYALVNNQVYSKDVGDLLTWLNESMEQEERWRGIADALATPAIEAPPKIKETEEPNG